MSTSPQEVSPKVTEEEKSFLLSQPELTVPQRIAAPVRDAVKYAKCAAASMEGAVTTCEIHGSLLIGAARAECEKAYQALTELEKFLKRIEEQGGK